MVEMSEIWRAVLNFLIEAPIAWQSPHKIAIALGSNDEEMMDLLCELDVAGWIVVWDASEGPVVTLSALAAERLGVHLIEVGPKEIPRWAPTSDAEPFPLRPKNICFSMRAATLDFALEATPPPEFAADRAEKAEDTILRSQIDEITATAKSLMPEEFEKQLGKQDVADIIAYLLSVVN